MELYFISHNDVFSNENVALLTATYVVDAYISCIWTRRYGNYNDFQIQLPATELNMANIQMYDVVYRSVDRYADIHGYYGNYPSIKNAMIVEKIEIDDNDDRHIMTISGRGIEAMFARMITWDKTTLQGKLKDVLSTVFIHNGIRPTFNAGKYNDYWYSIERLCQRTGDYTDLIPYSCRNMFCELRYDYSDVKDYDYDVVCDTVNDYLGDLLTQILKPLGMYWYIELEGIHHSGVEGDTYGYNVKVHVRDSWKHADLTNDSYDVLFAKDNGTLLSSKYTEDSTISFNCGQILGEGTGADQIRVAYPYDTGTALINKQPTKYNRHESIVDNSSYTADTIVLVDQYKLLLVQNTEYQAVKNNGQSMEVELNLKSNLFTYGDDNAQSGYDIGSVVGFKTETGILARARLVEMIESEDENGTKLTPTFDEWEFKTS